MMPNQRWDDFAIDQFSEMVKNYMEATAALPNQIAKLTANVEENTRRIDSHHAWIESIEKRVHAELLEVKALCERIGAEMRDESKERRKGWISIVVAIISAGAIIGAAIITAPH